MTTAGDDIWFGTTANPQCVAHGFLLPTLLVPYETESWVCEFGLSPYVPTLLPDIIGDFRPPQIFVYKKSTRTVAELTPKAPVSPTNPLGLDPLVYATRGFRSAAVIGNLVLIGGPSLLGSLNFFAFRADTREYLGSGTLPGYDNIRQMLVHNGVLYIPVGSNLVGGKVLRWTGQLTPRPCTACFQFETVANLDGIGAYIAPHEGRLFVTTWPTGQANVFSGVAMSPPVPPTGLTAAHANLWTKVWDATNYEPDRTIAAGYAGGGIASFDGYLYWGSMHVPWFATAIHFGVNGAPTTEQGWIEATIGTFRTTSLFRGRNFAGANPDIQLLYGMPYLPKYFPPSGGKPARWEFVENSMPTGRKTPLYGPPGFGNAFNNYTWNMTVWDNRLWVGTMDWSHTAEQGTKWLFKELGQPIPLEVGSFFAFQNFGADLVFFQSSRSPAVAESTNGMGNFTNFGARTLLNSGNLFIGTANPNNLLTGPLGPKGGWELIELEKKPNSMPLTLLTAFTCEPPLQTGAGVVQCTATVSRPSMGTGVTVGVLPILFDTTVVAPTTVLIPNGQISVKFSVQVGDPSKPTKLYLIAGVNGGTMVSVVDINPGIPRLSGLMTGKGKLASGVTFVDLELTNSGTGMAKSVILNQVLPRTLAGTGVVTYATGAGLSPALPVNLGPLAPGAKTTLRLHFNVPQTVSRFSVIETGTLVGNTGAAYNFSLAQSIIP